MFQTSESCIKLHVVVVLELLLSEHCSRCVCVCVSTAPGVCVCPLLQVCVCVHCSRCVCVCVHCSRFVCVCVSIATGVCVCVCPLLQVCVQWVKYREHISLLVILCIIVYVTKTKYIFFWIRLTKLLLFFKTDI